MYREYYRQQKAYVPRYFLSKLIHPKLDHSELPLPLALRRSGFATVRGLRLTASYIVLATPLESVDRREAAALLLGDGGVEYVDMGEKSPDGSAPPARLLIELTTSRTGLRPPGRRPIGETGGSVEGVAGVLSALGDRLAS